MALIIDSNPPVFSRKELLLRTFFGLAYIVIPHVVLLLISIPKVLMNYFVNIGAVVTNKKLGEETQMVLIQFINWLGNLHLSVYNLQDGYPVYGLTEQPGIFKVEAKRRRAYELLLLPFVLVFLILYLVLATPFVLLLTMISFFTVLITKRMSSTIYGLQLGHLDNVLRLTSRILLVK